MEHLGDMSHAELVSVRLEMVFSPFEDSANLNARHMHSLGQTYQRIGNHFGRTGYNSEVTWIMWNLLSVRLETVLVLVHDRCFFWAEQTIGLENHFGCTSSNS
jgi:hypothetical protein